MVDPEPGSGTQLVISSAGDSEVTRAEQIQVSPTWYTSESILDVGLGPPQKVGPRVGLTADQKGKF